MATKDAILKLSRVLSVALKNISKEWRLEDNGEFYRLQRNSTGNIVIPFEYENSVKMEYYGIEGPNLIINRVELVSINEFVENLDRDQLNDYFITRWDPSKHGWDCVYRITADYFLSNSKFMEIKQQK